MGRRRNVAMSPEEIESFLLPPRTAVLTTNGRGGFPHSTGMWFVPAGDEIEMWTYARSQKARNLERDPRCAVLIEDGTGYGELRGVLIQGRAQLIREVEPVAAIGRRLYTRYTLPTTGVAVEAGPEAEIERQARKRVGVILGLDRVASWDHTKL